MKEDKLCYSCSEGIPRGDMPTGIYCKKRDGFYTDEIPFGSCKYQKERLEFVVNNLKSGAAVEKIKNCYNCSHTSCVDGGMKCEISQAFPTEAVLLRGCKYHKLFQAEPLSLKQSCISCGHIVFRDCKESSSVENFKKELKASLDADYAFLVEKNRDYGDSALNPLRIFSKADAKEQIKVRIDDKLSRIARGNATIEDSVKDLRNYLNLLEVLERREKAQNG